MLDLAQFVLDEIERQRKSPKKIAVMCGWDKDRFYTWRLRGKPGEIKNVKVVDIQRALAVLGYELVPLPIGRREDG